MKRTLKSTLALLLCLCTIFSGTVIAFAADVAAPTNLTVTNVKDTGATLNWNGVSDVKGYIVYRSTKSDGGWEELDKTTKTTYTDEKANSGTIYYYAVRAYKLQKGWFNIDKYDTDKNRDYSDYVVSQRIISDPALVKGLMSTTVGATSISLAWNSSAGSKGYQIFMYDNATQSYKKIATTPKKTYTVRNLQDRTTYKFKVRSYHKQNGVTYSDFSNELSVTTSIADVTNFRLSNSSNETYTISWDASDRVSGFQLTRYDEGDGDWKVVKIGNSTVTKETSYTVNVKGGGYAKYKIRGYVEVAGKQTFGNWSAVVLGGTIPGTPVGLKIAANTDNGLSLTWDKLDGAAGYEVYCKDESGNWGSVGTTETNHFNHRNLTEKKTYEYKVRAYVGNTAYKKYGNFGETVKQLYEPIEIPEEVYPDDWKETGILGYLYDPNEKCFYTADDPWQRNFGYSEIYDNSAALVIIIIETNRIKFAYDNKDWMIPLWKGQYGWVLYGCEIGIYNKEKNRPVEHYTCANDDDMIQMEMVLWEKVEGKWVRTFGRPYERQWWHTGFVWGNMIGRNKDLQMRARITMRDFEMLDAVVKAFKEKGFKEVSLKITDFLKNPAVPTPDSFFVNGLDIYFYWTELFD